MKRILILMLSVLLMASLVFPVSAATQVQDGIEIEMVTDKAEYKQGEKITATLTITNTNDYDVNDLKLDGVVPDGYRVSRFSTLTVPKLAAGETKTLTVRFVPSLGWLWIILIVLLIVVVIAALVILYIFLLRRKSKQITAAVLCVAMLLSMASTTVLAAGNDMALPDDNFTGNPSQEETTAPTEPPAPTEETTEPSEDPDTPTDINVNDDFSTFAPSVGAMPSKHGWFISNESKATQTEDEKLNITELYYTVPEGITEDYTVEFKYQLPSDARAKIVIGQGIETSRAQVYLQFTGGGSTYADRVNFNKGNVTSNINYIFGGIEQWHTVQIAVKNSTKTYKMFVDGKQVNYGTDLEFAFYNNITKTNNIIFQCTSSNLMLDDFKIFKGEPEVEKIPPIEDPTNYSDDFSDFQPVVSGTAPITNNWWISSEKNATQTEDGKLKVSSLYYNVPQGITQDYTVEFKYQVPSDVSAQVIIGTGIETSNSQVRLKLTGGGSKYEDRVNFNMGNVTSNINYIFGGLEQWHTVQIAVSNTNKTYKLIVDGKQINYGTDVDFALYNDITKTTKVIFQCTSGDLLLDDFRVFLGEPEIDEGPVITNPGNYSDNFSNFQAMVSKTAPLKSYWWLTSESNATQTTDGKLKVTELNYYVPEGISDSYTVEFRYQLPKNGRAYLKMGESVQSTTLQVQMSLSGGDDKYDDRIKLYDGKKDINEIFSGIGKWHTIKIAVDSARKVYHVFFDGELLANDYGLYVNTISQLKRITWQCSNGDLLIDDFKITPGLPKIVVYDYTPVPGSDLIYEATFDEWKLGEIKGRQYKRWKASSKPNEGYTTSIMDVEGNRVLRFDQGEKGTYPTASYSFKEPMTTSFTLEVRLKQHPSAAGQISLQPASGGYGNAGPDLRFSSSGVEWYTLNGYKFSASDKAEDGWNIISVYVNMDLRTYDVYCNGTLMEEAIPFRNPETSELAGVIFGHATQNQPGITDIDYIRIYKGMKIIESTAEKPSLDGFEQLEAQIVAPRNPIPSNYSDVNLSTRNIRSDGSGGHEGSLDILKQFMVTYDRWVYSSSSEVTHRVTDLGVNMQQSVSPTSFAVYGVDVNCKLYDGTDFHLAWLQGSNHGCVNNPLALQQRLELLKTAVEDGSRSIQNDDPLYNWEFYKTGGCWCKYCVEKFTEFLLETYTTEELKAKAPNVTITSSFNYRNYLEKTYGWTTNEDYSTNRHLDPLEPYYEAFMKATTINYHTFVKEYLNSLGYGEIQYSANVKTASMELSATDQKKNASYYLFNESMPETNIGIMTRDTLNLAGIIDDALGRKTIFGVIPADGAANLHKLRMAAVTSYAMGTQAMIPWDTYVTTSHREWSSVEEVGDLYHFVRQYPYLFDDYEVPAILGIAMDPTNGENKTMITTLSNAGITVKALPYMTAGAYANYSFTAEDVEGLKYVLEATSLSPELKQIVEDSGAEKVKMYPILGDQDNLRFTWVENGSKDLYNIVRSYNGELGAATSIHVVNNTNGIAYDTLVGINRQYLPEGDYNVVLYRPCYDPVVLTASSYGRDITINASEGIKLDGSKVKLTVKVSFKLDSCVFYTVDEMDEWSILHIVPEGATEGVGAFDITDGWSSISLGTGLAEGDVITNNGDNSFTMTTSYLGDNVRTESDRTGSQDMMPFVYKNVTASKLMDYAIEGKVAASSNSGVMIREYPSSNARQVSLYVENGKLIAAARITDNKTMFYRELMDVTQDMYLKIVKTSASFEFYASVDGQDWGEKLISADMLLDKPLAGVFSFSGDGQSVANTVSEVKLTELGINENQEISDIEIPVDEKYFAEEYGDPLVISATTASGMTLFESDFDTITYTSSDESIMYVTDNRQIYGVNGGEATLTVVGTIGKYTVTGSANISVSSDGFVYVDENFDVWTPDTLNENWSISEAAGAKNNTYIFSANHPSETDNSMGISDFSTFQATAFYNFGSTPVKRNHTIEFDYYLETEREPSEISNLNTIYISSPLGYMTCLFYERGYFKFYDNTLWHNICETAPNQWVHIQIDIDFQEQTNVITITDSEGNVAQETYALRNAGTSVTSLRFTTNTTAQGLIAYYDNLKVYVKGKSN